MPLRRKHHAVLAFAVAVAAAGCTSLLGDYTQGGGSEEGGTLDGTTSDTSAPDAERASDGSGADSTAPGDASGPDGGNPGDGGGGEGGSIVDVVVHDGPQYAPPTVVTASAGSGAGTWSYDPSMLLVPPSGIVVASDTSSAGNGNVSAYALSPDGGAFGALKNFPTPTPTTGVYVEGYTALGRDSNSGAIYLSANGANASTSQPNQLAFLKSTNGAVSFDAGVNAADPALPASDFVDISSIAVDNAGGQGQGVVYLAYGRYVSATDIHMTVVSNGQMAYSTIVTPPTGSDQASLPSVAVGPNHYVYVVYYAATSGNPLVGFAKSTDQGAAFSSPATLVPLHFPFLAGTFNGNLGLLGQGLDGGATPVSFYSSPQVVCNPVTGAVYVTYVDATAGADKANIYFLHSEDGAQTWSTPVQVNDDTTTNDQFLPAMAVSPDGTRLAIDFYDRRNDPNNLVTQRYGATATIEGSTVKFDPNFQVSKGSFPIYPLQAATPEFSIHSAMAADATRFYDAFTTSTITPAAGTLQVEFARYGVLY